MNRESALLAIAAAIVLTGTVVAAGCRPQADQQAADQQAAAASQAERATSAHEVSQTYQTTGVIRSITPRRNFATIRHADISGFMEAMTMLFAVADSSLLAGIQPGDSVAFTFTLKGNGAVVQALHRAGP